MGSQRNLVIILTAGQRGDALGGAGVWPVDTPHLDRLASSGLALTAISPAVSNNAAMRSLCTGLHPRQQGGEVGGFVKQLKEEGYYTAAVGRVGLIADAMDARIFVAEVDQMDAAGCQYLQFAERRGLMRRIEQQRKLRLRSGPFELSEVAEGCDPVEDVDGYIGAQAAAMVARLPGDQPWAMIVAFTGPGNYLPAPAMYRDAIDDRKLSRGFIPAAMGEVDCYARLDYPRHLLQQVDGARAAAIRRHYLARMMLIDCCVGRVREAVGKRRDANATWTLLTSDHGEVLGDRGLFGCQTFVGSGAYVPLWITPPQGRMEAARAGNEALREKDGLVSGVDFAATVCALAGVDELDGCTGKSLLEGFGGNVGREAVLSEDKQTVLLHTMRHKAVYESATGKLRVLFDLKHDPSERTNLADSPYHANVMDSLQAALARVLLPLGAGRS